MVDGVGILRVIILKSLHKNNLKGKCLPAIMVFMKSGSPACPGCTGYVLEDKWFCNFPYNGNPTRELNTTALKYCLPSNDAIDSRENSRMRVWVQGHFMQVSFIEIHQVFAKKKRSDTFLTECVYIYIYIYIYI